MILDLDPDQADLIADALTSHVVAIVRKLDQPKVRGAAILRRERVMTIDLLRIIREGQGQA